MRLVLLTSDICPPCTEAKEGLKSWIDGGDIEIVRGESDEGADLIVQILDKNMELAAPMLMMIDHNNRIFGDISLSIEEVLADK